MRGAGNPNQTGLSGLPPAGRLPGSAVCTWEVLLRLGNFLKSPRDLQLAQVQEVRAFCRTQEWGFAVQVSGKDGSA